MTPIFIQYHKTPIGELILGTHQDKLCLLDFRYRKMRKSVDDRIKKMLCSTFVEQQNSTLTQAQIQIDEYLEGVRTAFDIPTIEVGTLFQQKVWQALKNIPYGKTSSYAELAYAIGNANAVRAVASANGANALALINPCHRVIGADGTLVGYGGGLRAKKKLLVLESQASIFTEKNLFTSAVR